MASILHGNAKTTPRIRKEIQESEESIAALAKKYNINFKTVLYWKHADSVEDKKSGPKTRPSVLTELEQQAICTVRRHLRLSLDELYIIFKPNIPKLSRSNLHRCLQHHGLSRLPKNESDGQKGKKHSNNIRLALSISTSPRCVVKPASCTCLSPSTAKPNMFMQNFIRV
ncbi:hypothetical protein [Paralysiella testudinis]|uniref:Transposase n=1 Tax=Paralysiella testudinis TaxID=2809020 RepID=A0A892ZLD6_9NEIS|nr:hypothetical protein [Paralysiella testudinis]QRQ82364.1 hypothetical protein JQU52_02850 [Paralysiella testudinis]